MCVLFIQFGRVCVPLPSCRTETHTGSCPGDPRSYREIKGKINLWKMKLR